MNTINTLIKRLKAALLLALFAVAPAGVMAHNHASYEQLTTPGWTMIHLGQSEASIAARIFADKDNFTFFLQDRMKTKHKGYVKATCYENYENYEGRPPATWTKTVKGLDNTQDKRQPGYACYNGYLDISLDPDGGSGNAEWRFVGRLFPCTGKWRKSHVKLALVTEVSDDRRHARVLAACKKGNHQWHIPRPDSDDYQMLSNFPGEQHNWVSRTNTPPEDGRFAVHLHGNQDFFDKVQGHVKWSCYTYDPDGGKNHRHKWTKTVIPLQVKYNGKTYRGERCRNGFIDVSIDPDEANGDAEWVFIGRLYECDYNRNVRFAWVNQVHDKKRHAILKTGCFAEHHFYEIRNISPDSPRLSAVGRWPGQKLPWSSGAASK